MSAADETAGPAARIWRFGPAEFDEQRRELRVDGELRTVEAKPLDVLFELLCRAGEVATSDDLLAAVWGSTVKQSLTTAINKLRAALGDQGRMIVEAVHGKGYRISLPIELRAAVEKPRLAFSFAPGDPVPNRPQWRLERLLGSQVTQDVWRARHGKTGEARVFKFADTGERLEALKRESALSRILHTALGDRPDLVRVIEWNFDRRPFYIESPFGGDDLLAWVAAKGVLSTIALETRIEIIARIARVAAAAHGVGVLHRDIKPANVLVSETAGGILVRLVDFGSGRLMEAARLEAVTVTGLGLTAAGARDGERISGTLRYMAPEILAGGAPTIAADVYALGVLLYQMVAGDLNQPLTAGWEAEIADPLLRADVAHAAAGDPTRRLASAAVLAERLETLHTRRADAARQENEAAEMRRLVLRVERERLRRPWLIVAAACLVLGVVGTSMFALREHRARDEALRQAGIARAINRFLTDDIIAAADPDVSGRSDVTVAAAIRGAAARVDGVLGNSRPQERAAVHAAMQTAFLHLTDYNGALLEGDRALTAVRTEHSPNWSGFADIQLTIADTLITLGRLSEVEARLTAADQAISRLSNPSPELSARLWLEKGLLTFDLPTYLHDAQAAWKSAQLTTDLSPRLRDRVLMLLGDAYQMLGRNAEAETILRRLLQEEKADYGPDDARSSFIAVVLAATLRNQGRVGEGMTLVERAIPNLERTLGPFARRTIEAKDYMAGFYYVQSKFDEAARLWTEVIAGYEHSGIPSEIHHVGAETNLAMALIRGKRDGAAEQILRKELEEVRSKLGPEVPDVQLIRFNLAYALLDMGKPEEVAALRSGLDEKTLNMAEQEPDWPGRLTFLDGRLALEKGNKTSALALLTKAQLLLGSEGDDGRISPAVIVPLIREASVGVNHP